MHAVVDQIVEVLAVLGPVGDFGDRALDLAAGDRDRAADLGDHDAAQPLFVAFQRLGELDQAVVAKVQVTRPVGGVERAPCRTDRASHVLDRAIGGLPGDLLAGRMDDIESGTAGGRLQFTVDEHAWFAGQHTGLGLSCRHDSQLYKKSSECHAFVTTGPSRGQPVLMPTACRSCARNWSSSSLRTM